jgi:ubiquinone biosynthesis protein UbiJ
MDLDDKITKALRCGFSDHDEGITAGITRICVEHAEEEHQWLVSEINDLRQTVEELEIELMMLENDIQCSSIPVAPLNLKKRGNF